MQIKRAKRREEKSKEIKKRQKAASSDGYFFGSVLMAEKGSVGQGHEMGGEEGSLIFRGRNQAILLQRVCGSAGITTSWAGHSFLSDTKTRLSHLKSSNHVRPLLFNLTGWTLITLTD